MDPSLKWAFSGQPNAATPCRQGDQGEDATNPDGIHVQLTTVGNDKNVITGSQRWRDNNN